MMKRMISNMARCMLDFSAGILINAHPEWNPRVWSNKKLRELGSIVTGDVINVSAGADGDKEGDLYRNYFPNADSYATTNYGDEFGKSGLENEYLLDLSVLYDGRYGTYDVVFSHTVIEHVYPSNLAFDNLCALSKNLVITVVPFLQALHGVPGVYDDYYRYSPLLLEKEFADRGFQTLYVAWNQDIPIMNVYIIHIASKVPEPYASAFPASEKPVVNLCGPGVLHSRFLWPYENAIGFWRRVGDALGNMTRKKH
jgi:hypothetical protein